MRGAPRRPLWRRGAWHSGPAWARPTLGPGDGSEGYRADPPELALGGTRAERGAVAPAPRRSRGGPTCGRTANHVLPPGRFPVDSAWRSRGCDGGALGGPSHDAQHSRSRPRACARSTTTLRGAQGEGRDRRPHARQVRRDPMDPRDPSVRVVVHLVSGRARCSSTLRDSAAHPRLPGREDRGAARETLAAAIVLWSGWDRRQRPDPMCGSGTIPIEAALRGGLAWPGRRFARALARFDAERREWRGCWRRPEARGLGLHRVDPRLGPTTQSWRPPATRPPSREPCHLRSLTRAAEPGDGRGTVVFNPPYGHRMTGRPGSLGAFTRRPAGISGASAAGRRGPLRQPGFRDRLRRVLRPARGAQRPAPVLAAALRGVSCPCCVVERAPPTTR